MRCGHCIRAVAWLVLIHLFVMPAAPLEAGEALVRESIVLVSGAGEQRLDVEIANSDATRARGLMFRRSLGPDQGMLFLYDGEQPISMWMRNTYISLDMIFIRADGRIQSIARNTEPFSESVIRSGGPVSAVLEIAAGEAKRYGLKVGDEVRHSRFGNTP